ncbi:MAG: putative lipid II flippase FtsW [Polyangiales bacterium]
MSLFRMLASRLGRKAPEGEVAPGDAIPAVAGHADPVLTAVVVALVGFGVVMVYSASAVFADRQFHDGHYFLIRQSIYAVLGIATMFAAAGIDYHRYRPLTYPILGITVLLLFLVGFGMGRTAGGATRWLQIGPVNIQPAEVAKVAIIFWLAYSLSKKRDRLETFSVGFLPHALMAGFLMLLCLKQPDFGSAVMIGLLTFVLMFAAGTRIGYLLGATLGVLPVLFSLVYFSEYRMERIRGFLDPFAHRQDEGFQIFESLVSFGSGGVLGVGLGDSRQKLFFLPEAHTDFISAIVGEELGFLGILALISAFTLVVVQGYRAAFRAADDYGTYLAVGITTFVGLQAFTNLAVAMGMVPTKGLVLPFLSYGGSSLIVNCGAIGVLLNVSRPRVVAEAPQSTDSTGPGATVAREKRNVARGPRNVALGGAA